MHTCLHRPHEPALTYLRAHYGHRQMLVYEPWSKGLSPAWPNARTKNSWCGVFFFPEKAPRSRDISGGRGLSRSSVELA